MSLSDLKSILSDPEKIKQAQADAKAATDRAYAEAERFVEERKIADEFFWKQIKSQEIKPEKTNADEFMSGVLGGVLLSFLVYVASNL